MRAILKVAMCTALLLYCVPTLANADERTPLSPAERLLLTQGHTAPEDDPAPDRDATEKGRKDAVEAARDSGGGSGSDSGFRFNPRGRINLDFGHITAPSSTAADSGFGGELRRIRLGASGNTPGGLNYLFEVDFAGNDVVLFDGFLTFENRGLTITAGQHNNFQGLDETSSGLHNSFLERSAWTDAFGFQRRLGVSAQYATGDWLLQAGVFGDNIEDLPSDSRSVDARIIYAPVSAGTQMHFGASAHYNDLGDQAQLRYRQRPLVRWTDNRFVDTGTFSATSEVGLGLEAAAIKGPFHVALEGYSQTVNRPGELINPTFLGASAEVGFVLTSGDQKEYSSARLGGVDPASPIDQGGTGAFQLNLRYDYLDLNASDITGGTQNAFQASFVWTLTKRARLMINYALQLYSDAAFTTAGGSDSFTAHIMGGRAQVFF